MTTALIFDSRAARKNAARAHHSQIWGTATGYLLMCGALNMMLNMPLTLPWSSSKDLGENMHTCMYTTDLMNAVRVYITRNHKYHRSELSHAKSPPESPRDGRA